MIERTSKKTRYRDPRARRMVAQGKFLLATAVTAAVVLVSSIAGSGGTVLPFQNWLTLAVALLAALAIGCLFIGRFVEIQTVGVAEVVTALPRPSPPPPPVQPAPAGPDPVIVPAPAAVPVPAPVAVPTPTPAPIAPVVPEPVPAGQS